MGFFNKPGKAMKSFVKNPVRVISNDLNNLDKKINPPIKPPVQQKFDNNQYGFQNNNDKAIVQGAPPNQYNILPGDSEECKHAKNRYNLYNDRLYNDDVPSGAGPRFSVDNQKQNIIEVRKAAEAIPTVCKSRF